MSRGRLFVITAPSGCGKSSLRRLLVAKDSFIEFCPSVTTRVPRPGEVDGQDYYFVSPTAFARMRQEGDLAEWAEVYGNFYGTPKGPIEKVLGEGSDVIVEKDVQGAMTLREVYPDATFIFILPPSLDELTRRIIGRGTERPEDRERRLRSARTEMSDLGRFDYVIINVDLDRASDRLAAIVAGERAYHRRRTGQYDERGPK